MIIVIAVVAILLLVVVAVVFSDQAIARTAERLASTYLTAPLGGAAVVRVHGEPFLTQALRGRYTEVQVTGSDLRMGEIGGASLDARLRNVYLPLRALLGRRVSELPCERVAGTIVVPYTELARLSRVPTLTLRHDGRRVLASLSIPIPGISSLARVTGEALVSVDAGGAVWLRMRGVAVAGFVVPSLVLNQLLPTLRFLIPLPPLPYGLRIADLDTAPSGVVVHGAADAVVFKKTS